MKKILLTAVALLVLSAITGATAQVTIGSTADPQPFSILELDGHGERGLRLPQLNATQQQALTVELTGLTDQVKKDAARGLQIFNTKTKCVETWNGTKWIQQCREPDPWVEMPAITGCKYNGNDMVIPPVSFAKFNLGADPQYDTPKKQMKYLAETSYPKNGVTLQLDATVNGGLFQWGRKDHEHAVNPENFTRYNGTDNTWNCTYHSTNNPTGDKTPIDANGQPTDAAAGKFIYSNYFTTSDNNWYPDASSNQAAADALWGNGVNVNITTPEGVLYGTDYYQSTKWIYPENNPCPDGFRVPTQDEWERLGNYGCNPYSSSGDVYTYITGGKTNEGLTWVPVVCNRNNSGRCVPDNIWSANTTASGYAIYETAEWDKAITTGGVYAEWAAGSSPTTDSFNYKNADGITYKYPSLHEEDTAPEPLLFLPIAGYRSYSNGTVYDTGGRGKYWSSIVNLWSARYIDFQDEDVYPGSGNPRSYGFSIRCVVK